MDKQERTRTERADVPASRAEVSPAVVRRLPRYHRYLGELLRDNRLRISSSELSHLMNVTASQIRQDLNCFGGFGQQGYGYNVKYLYGKISELLGVEEHYGAVIVGAGHLGCALASSHMFERRGVVLKALFDTDHEKIGSSVSSLPVLNAETLREYCRAHDVRVVVLTTPKEAAPAVARQIIDTGVRGIWNFSNMELKVDDPNITVENVHMGDSLLWLTYEMRARENATND